MESIELMVATLKSELEGIVKGGDLSGYTVQDINKMLTYKDRIGGGSWDENMKSSKELKQRYLDWEGVPIERKLEAILTWGDYGGKGVEMNGFKKEIIGHLQEGLGFEVVWDLLKKGKLVFGKDDAGLLSVGFIDFICKRKLIRGAFKKVGERESESDSDDGYEDVKHINLCPIEKFLINLLMFEYKSDENIKIMKMLTGTSDPRLHFLPQKITRFNGELMSQIIPHYKSNYISPVIDCRRGVGIILENQRRQFYEYEKFIESNGRFLATQISIELPYMCYGYIKEIEVDLMDFHGGGCGENQPTMFISTGTEYVAYPFQECKKWEKGYFDSSLTLRQEMSEGFDMPCTYIGIHFGFTGTLFPSIRAIRLYGDAVSFI